jgi:High potential iron-sulfur protein
MLGRFKLWEKLRRQSNNGNPPCCGQGAHSRPSGNLRTRFAAVNSISAAWQDRCQEYCCKFHQRLLLLPEPLRALPDPDIESTLMNSRRQFIITLVPAALALGAAPAVLAQTAKADENDPVAKSLGYKQDASKVDAAKYPSFAKGKVCSNCQLYQGKAGDAWGACPILAGKQVNGNGWCSAWAKKAG